MMTGIIRKVDDLGRVVIPREIRKNLGIHEGDPLEIFITKDGGVEFRPYKINLVNSINDLCENLCDNVGDFATNVTIRRKCEEIRHIVQVHTNSIQ